MAAEEAHKKGGKGKCDFFLSGSFIDNRRNVVSGWRSNESQPLPSASAMDGYQAEAET